MNSSDMHMHAAAGSLLKPADATHIAIRDGDWTDPGTWAGGRVPGPEARVHVPDGISIVYDARSSPGLEVLRLDGTLSWTRAHDTEMRIETIVTMPGSTFEIGTEAEAMPADINASIIFRDTPIDAAKDPQKLSHGLVAHGTVSIEGAAKESYLTLEQDARAGATTIKVDGDVTNWAAGDKILVVGTGYEGEDANGVLRTQDEVRTIVSVRGDTITFDKPLNHDHTPPAGMDVDLYVGNLSRNVAFRSENPDGTRGHVMLHNSESDGTNAPANSVRHAAFEDLGRTDSTRPIDGNNPEGRYPLHLHMTGTDAGDGSSVLEGNAVSGGPGWGIVQHSSKAQINDNLVFDITGAGIVSETGDETGAWMRNLVSGVTGYDAPNKNGDANQGAAYDNESRVIVQQDNIAANSKLGWNFSGQEDFPEDDAHGGAPRDGAHRKMFERDQVKFDPSPFDVALDHEEPPIVDFVGNEVIAATEAFRVYHRQFSDDTDTMSVIRDFTIWGGEDAINLKNYSSNYEFVDSVFQGSGEGFRVERKTSAVVFNDVEFRDFGLGYHSYGVNHESALIDVDFVNVRSEFRLEDLMKNVSSASERQALIDYFRSEYGIDYTNPMPRIVDSSTLTPVDRVTFVADADADLTIGSGDATLKIKGKIIDSLGERTFNEYLVAKTPSGATGSKEFDGVTLRFGSMSNGLQTEFTFDEFLDLHGTFRKPDGTWVVPVVNWITDRLTADQHPVVIELTLDGVDRARLKAHELDAYPDPGINHTKFDYGFDTPGSTDGGDDHGGHGGHGGTDNGAGDQGGTPEPGPDPDRGDTDDGPDAPDGDGGATPPDVIGDLDLPTAPLPHTSEADTVRGSAGDEVLFGGGGNDILDGRDGDDILVGGAGADKYTGGKGADVFVLEAEMRVDGREDVKDFNLNEGDSLVLRDVPSDLASARLGDWLRFSKAGTIGELEIDLSGTGTDFRSVAIFRDGRDLSVAKLLDEDALTIVPAGGGGGGTPPDPQPETDTSADEDGNLAISVASRRVDLSDTDGLDLTITGLDDDATGKVYFMTEDDRSVIRLKKDGTVTVDLADFDPGAARIRLIARDDDGNVARVAAPGVTLFDGGAADAPAPVSTVPGTAGNDLMRGGAVADLLAGRGGDDTMFGRGGDDVLSGGAGANKLYGEGGADTFLFTAASLDGRRDDVKDFDLAEGDVFEFRGLGAAGGNPGTWLDIQKSGTTGILRIDATGRGDDFEDLAIIRGGRGLTIDDLLAADALVVG